MYQRIVGGTAESFVYYTLKPEDKIMIKSDRYGAILTIVKDFVKTDETKFTFDLDKFK